MSPSPISATGAPFDPVRSSLEELLAHIAGLGRNLRATANTADGMPARVVVRIDPGAATARSVRRLDSLARMSPMFDGAEEHADPFDLASYRVFHLDATRGDIGSLGHDLAYKLLDRHDVLEAYYEGARLEQQFPDAGPTAATGPVTEAVSKAVSGPGTGEGIGDRTGDAGDGDGDAPADTRWARKAIRVPEETSSGKGVVIAHPDTGWTRHPELPVAALDLEKAWNTLNDTTDAMDPLDFPTFVGHGTATASLMVSDPAGPVYGIVPEARLVPIRCARSVVLVLDIELAQAVWRAIRAEAHLLSISLGGLPLPALQRVLRHAVETAGMVVCAAAGNEVPFVVYPAAYPECVAVAGTTPTDRPWKRSSFGGSVDIAAPAHLVWVGEFDENRRPVLARPGSGTSFAAPHVASAVALWLAKHGPNALRARYGADLHQVATELLRSTARLPGPFAAPGGAGDVAEGHPYTWDTARYGPGIVDVAALLAADLPDSAPPRAHAAGNAPAGGSEGWHSWTDTLAQLCPELTRPQLDDRLAALLGAAPLGSGFLRERYGAEVAQRLATDAAFRTSFVARPSAASETAETDDTGDAFSRTLRASRNITPPAPLPPRQ